MAPMLSNESSSFNSNPGNFLRSQNTRENSWEFTGSEQHSEGSIEESVEQAFFDGGDSEYGDRESNLMALLDGPDGDENTLHPHREAANRVGREIERFAEVLDGYNPIKVLDNEKRYEMTFDLIELYHNIALETVERLRSKHSVERRKEDGARWRKKMRGFKITQDPELMDTDDIEEQENSTSTLSRTTIHDLERWEEEARTWDLLKRLAELNHSQPTSNIVPTSIPERPHRFSSDRQIWDAFLRSDALALERHTVLEWLQDTAEESGEDIDVLVQELQQNAERGDIIAHGWLHTKAAIKNQKRIHVWPHVLDPSSPDVQKVHLNSSRTEFLVTQLDPDAPTRQNRKLEIQDQYFERAIWLGCYELLRRGKSAEDIKEWCGDRTEIWRAVSMCGLFANDTEDQASGQVNTSSALWRRMCFALARRGGSDDYERAVYGILSGDLSTVEQVSRSWDDHLFAHYNALVKSQFELYLRSQYPDRLPSEVVQAHSIFDAVQFHGDPKTAGKRLVDTLNNTHGKHSGAIRPMKMLQGVLIARQFENFIYQQGLALAKFANEKTESALIPKFTIEPENDDDAYIPSSDFDSLRVLVHMIFIFKNLGMNCGDSLQQMAIENVIVGYIDFLRLAGKEELIPLYVSQLDGDRRYATISRELIDITDPEQRVTQIKLMKELGLDVQKFIRFQTQFLFMDFPDDTVGYPADGAFKILEEESSHEGIRRIRKQFIGRDVDRTDLLLIRSLEWHLLVEGLWSETFATGVLLYKRFFKHNKLAAARNLAQSVLSSEISLRKTGALLGESLDLTNIEVEGEDEDVAEATEESSKHKRLLKRHLARETKSFCDLELLMRALDAFESAGDSYFLIANDYGDKMMKDARNSLHRSLQLVKIHSETLLQDWLTTSQEDEPEFKLLREAYLPEIVLAYDSILHCSGLSLSRDNLLACMELSTMVAADSDLVDLIVKKGRLQELVQAFAENSKAILYANTMNKSRMASNSKKIRKLGWSRDLWNITL